MVHRSCLFVCLAALTFGAAVPDAVVAQDLSVSPKQQTAARVGLAFGIGTQVVTLGSGLVYAIGVDAAIVPFSGASWVAPGMAVAGIQGFEGILRDGTLAGHYRGLGTGFLEGGIYSLSVSGVLGLGLTFRTFGFEDGSVLYLYPAIAVYAGVGVGMTVAGALLLAHGRKLRSRDAAQRRRSAVQVVPVFSPAAQGFRVGLHGVF